MNFNDDRRILRRAWQNVVFDESGCWIWKGIPAKNGYGTLSINGKTHYAHRIMYQRYRGPIPSDLQCDHLCRIRSCCKPGHIELVTRKENILRGVGVSAFNARRENCPKCGGPYRKAPPRGTRICGPCTNRRAGDRHKQRMREDPVYRDKYLSYHRKRKLEDYHRKRLSL